MTIVQMFQDNLLSPSGIIRKDCSTEITKEREISTQAFTFLKKDLLKENRLSILGKEYTLMGQSGFFLRLKDASGTDYLLGAERLKGQYCFELAPANKRNKVSYFFAKFGKNWLRVYTLKGL